MKLFLDTANLEEIRTGVEWGILDRITTNPSLAAKEGRRFEELVGKVAELVDGPVSAEVVAEAREEMVAQGKDLAQIADNIVVKVPLTREGIAAGWRLTGLGIPVNVTLVFSSVQAILAARIGADVATMPFEVMDRLFNHPLTDIGNERFRKDWEAYQEALDDS